MVIQTMVLVTAAIASAIALVHETPRYCEHFDGMKARVAVTPTEWREACIEWDKPVGRPSWEIYGRAR